MMPTVTLTAAALAVVRKAAIFPFSSKAVPRQDGDFDVPVSDRVHARLVQFRHPGETFSETIMRVALNFHRDDSNNRRLH